MGDPTHPCFFTNEWGFGIHARDKRELKVGLAALDGQQSMEKCPVTL